MIEKNTFLRLLPAFAVFEEAARHLSFTQAGESLGMAQPSVSRFVTILEQHLGVSLFERRHNRIALTPHGDKLQKAAMLGLDHLRSVVDDIAQSPSARKIMIHCTHGFAHMWVLPRLDALKARLSGHEFGVVTTDQTADETAAPPLDHQHVAVWFGDGDWPQVSSILLFKERVFPVCTRAFAEKHSLDEDGFTAADFHRLPLLWQDAGTAGWLDWQGWFDHFGAPLPEADPIKPESTGPTRYVINNYAFILQAAMEGRGIALAWDHLIEPYLSNGWLVSLPDFRVDTHKGYYLAVPKGHPAMSSLRQWIGETS
ncbi:MAG: LysR family transcriptional regulator [Pseudomonadota bacterium]